MFRKEEEQPQYDLGLKQPKTNALRQYRQKIMLKLRFLETKGYLRSPYPWFFIFLSIALIAVQVYWIYYALPEMPSQVPIYLNQRDLAERLAPKMHIYIFPIFSGIIFVASFIVTSKFYYLIKILSNYTFVIAILSITMLTLGLFQIIAYYNV
ncbi:MAG: hypothetical protein QY318_01970 [Candidatus Dojkabacteria bacterium]|nr:MAG: hypothetical protein QY318_01970 [Candidatus Dojkabacteria bacterium]